MSLSGKFMWGLRYELMLASDSCICAEVWPHNCVKDWCRFLFVSNLSPVQIYLCVTFVLKFQFFSLSKFGFRH